jgi:hypothetical protein
VKRISLDCEISMLYVAIRKMYRCTTMCCSGTSLIVHVLIAIGAVDGDANGYLETLVDHCA